MVKNLKRLRKQTEREMGKKEAESFDFFPTTYELPVSIVFACMHKVLYITGLLLSLTVMVINV